MGERPYVEWVVVDAVGSAGGIIVLRDSRFVTLLNKWKDVFSASVLRLLVDLEINSRWLLTNV